MANIKQIRRRIKSAENISQITRAMEMVAASKMKKAQTTAVNSKPYADKINQAVRILAHKVIRSRHPLLGLGTSGADLLIILISTNKGLAGGLNTNLFRFLIKEVKKEESRLQFVSVGKKGKQFVVRWHKKLLADFSESLPFTLNIPAIIKLVTDGFISGQFSEVILVYNNFVSALVSEPVKKTILPITNLEEATQEELKVFGEFELEPNAAEILNGLLPNYLENQLRGAILEAEACEHSSRMIAMKNATDAAYDLIDDLTLVFNKARQASITYEIADMVTARLSIK